MPDRWVLCPTQQEKSLLCRSCFRTFFYQSIPEKQPGRPGRHRKPQSQDGCREPAGRQADLSKPWTRALGKSREKAVGQEPTLPINQVVRDRAKGLAMWKETHTCSVSNRGLPPLCPLAEYSGAACNSISRSSLI